MIALLACGVLGVLLHYVDVTSNLVARLGSVAPYLMLAAPAGLTLSLFSRRARLIVPAVAVTAAAVLTQAPLYLGSANADGHGATLTVLQANIYLGRADVPALARTVQDRDVDVLTVSELTDAALDRIRESGIADRLPYSVVYPVASGGGGTGLFSRYPLENGTRLTGEGIRAYRMANVRAEALVPGFGRLALYAVHPVPPWPEPAWHWAAELDSLGATLRAEPLPAVIGGDFNSTYDHAQLRALFGDAALTDAAEHTGAGIVATYPANRTLIPPVLALDRIATRGGPEPVSFERVRLPGSDHYAVLSRIRL